MIVVGLTGGIGSRKSTVAALLARRGAVVIDADQVAREIAAPGGAAYRALVDHFGPGVVGSDGVLDRAAIAARVFSDPAELAALNAITHPAIGAALLNRLVEAAEGAGSDRRVVLEIPLLTGAMKERYGMAGVVVVDAPVEVAIDRLVRQRGLEQGDAEARVRSQAGREERRRLADVVVDNSGTRHELEAAVERLWSWMGRLAVAGAAGAGGAGAGAAGVSTAAGAGPTGAGRTGAAAAGGSVDGPAQEAAHADRAEDDEEHD